MANKKDLSSEKNKDGNAVNDAVPEEISVDPEGTPILFMPSPSQWGDCVVPEVTQPGSPEKTSEKPPSVLKVLCDLYNNGTCYETGNKVYMAVFSVDTC